MTEIEHKMLSSEQRIGAFLEAQGEKRSRIAEATGVVDATVTRWRALPEYRAEIERWQSVEADLTTRISERVRLELADAGTEAVRALVHALSAQKKGGEPSWGIRLEAAEKILAYVPPRALIEAGGRDARALAAVTLVVRRDGDRTEIVEGEATEALS